MGNRGVTSGGSHADRARQHARESKLSQLQVPRELTLRDWPVSWRLIAVIVLALVMGLVFGGLRVAAAAGSAAQFGRVAQLANLGQQVTGLVQALENERDETTGLLPITSTKDLKSWYAATDASAARVRGLAAGIGGSFPANIQSRVATMVSTITHLDALRSTAQASQSVLAVIAGYSAPISDMIALNDQIAQGTSDSVLANDVQALNSLSLAKDQAAQQRALLFNALNQQIFADGVQQALTTAQSEELSDLTAFGTTATAQEQSAYRNTVAGPRVNHAQNIEIYIVGTGSLDIGAGALGIGPAAAPGQWYSAQSVKVNDMQQVELGIARKIVARAQTLQRGAERSALTTAIVTAVILLLVLVATAAVARSMVRPLRRLREGALDIATVQLPERVRQLSEALDPTASLEVAPIDVTSADEIGQVARAFDQVHSEAVRLAGNEAMLRRSFNAMFVNLSRRSQSLIERLVRLIDSLEQNEDDPGRLANLFSMDHLVTRMRRNSENLLLLAGHDTARKWSGPVPLTDVARAAASEIEQYSRVTLRIQPGVAVAGQAVSDVVHLLAEVIENATVFSPEDTQVHVSAQELTSGGVLIEVSDNGVGVPEARLAELNWRLDNPPVIDVAASRHMGLFAVAHLAARHGVRVRLRARSPEGLTALVWLPDSVAAQGTQPASWPASGLGDRLDRQTGAPARPATGGHRVAARPVPAGPVPASTFPVGPVPAGTFPVGPVPASTFPAGPVPAGAVPAGAVPAGAVPAGAVPAGPVPVASGARETARSSGSPASPWFRSHQASDAGTAAGHGNPAGTAPQADGVVSGAAPRADSGRGGADLTGADLAGADLAGADLAGADLAGADLAGASLGGLGGAGFGGLAGADLWANGRHAAQVVADPVRGDQTAAGLPVRVPRANLLPGSAGGGRAGGDVAGRRADGRDSRVPAAADRSPELARSRLSGFQGGIRRAKDQAPGAGEETRR